MQNIIVIDDFYQNVNQVRELALSMEFNVTGNYPGTRTQSTNNDSIKPLLEKFTQSKISFWPEEYNLAFQSVTKDESTWIHRDKTVWAGVIFLSPDAPVESGTAFYRNKKSNYYEYWDGCKVDYNDSYEDSSNVDLWDEHCFVGNVYNRLVLYRGYLYHRSKVPGFGTDLTSSRLTQTLFFDTES